MAEDEGTTLEFTPTCVVAVVCTVIVVFSLAVERFLYHAGEYLKKTKQKPLFVALQKIKEELMLLGFISLLLAVFQSRIVKICISEKLSNKWLPCKEEAPTEGSGTTSHFLTSFFPPGGRRLLAEASASPSTDYCSSKGKVSLLSLAALHQMHIFIFVLAVVHVVFCALTILCGQVQILLWKRWEDAILKSEYEYDPEGALPTRFTNVQGHTFTRGRFLGIGKNSSVLGWVRSFFKQFCGLTKSDYITLRLGFIMAHFRGNQKFDFDKYMIRSLKDNFENFVGVSWYLWLFIVVFLLLNVAGWHAYFWMSFVPLILLLAVRTKLHHVITQLAQEVAERHVAIEGDLVVRPFDHHFWLNRPRLILVLIHIILFQNSFELAFFFFVLVQYKFSSCIMGEVGYIIPRLVIGVFVQFLCSCSTLPLYAIAMQMGPSLKKAIFDDPIREGLVRWAQRAKKNKKIRKAATDGSSAQTGSKERSVGVERTKNGGDGTEMGDVKAQ